MHACVIMFTVRHLWCDVLQLSAGQHAVARQCATPVCNSSGWIQNSSFIVSVRCPWGNWWRCEDATMGWFVHFCYSPTRSMIGCLKLYVCIKMLTSQHFCSVMTGFALCLWHPSHPLDISEQWCCLEDKRVNYQNCSMLCSVRQLCIMICTHLSRSYRWVLV